MPNVPEAFFQDAIQAVLDKIDQNLGQFTERFPTPSSQHNVYAVCENDEWTASFWTGMLWLAYELTGAVKWTQSVEAMIRDGATKFMEVGPGKVLHGLIWKIDKNVMVEGVH